MIARRIRMIYEDVEKAGGEVINDIVDPSVGGFPGVLYLVARYPDTKIKMPPEATDHPS
jgi:hypothetical protein